MSTDRAPLDPQIRAELDRLAVLGLPAMETMSIEELRARELAGIDTPAGEPVARVENRAIPGPGGPISLRIYWPAGVAPFPCLVYFHGGGFILGSLDTHDAICRAITNGAECVAVSVGYRLAPEHPFPAAVEDCYAATEWVSAHAAEIQVDRRRIAARGNSAGGNLAAVVAQLARDNGGPHLVYQWLMYPVMDRPDTTPSYEENAEGYGLTRTFMRWCWQQYVPDRSFDLDPRAAPLQAENLHDLPPALIVTAEYDPLRDEGERYAQRLKEAGVGVQLVRYEGMNHGFLGQAKTVDRAREALADVIAELRANFGGSGR